MPTFGNFTREEEPLLQSFFESLACDMRQTSSWGDLGVSEINPLIAPYTTGKGNNPMIPVVMGAESAVALTAIGSIKDKGLRKALLTALALGEGFVTATNGHVYPSQHDRFGAPVPGQPSSGIYAKIYFQF